MIRLLLASLVVLVLAEVGEARTANIEFDDNSTDEDTFILSRKNAHCSVSGPFTDIATLPAQPGTGRRTTTDPNSPFPYACYHVRATRAGAADSGLSNDDNTTLPLAGAAARHRLR